MRKTDIEMRRKQGYNRWELREAMGYGKAIGGTPVRGRRAKRPPVN